MRWQAYWISPAGKILFVPHHHIDLVINEPETFGLTLRKIKTAYKKHNEPLHMEGLARHNIMSKIIQKGWIRIRYNPRGDFFMIQPFRLDIKTKNHIRKWAIAICGKTDNVSKNTGIKICAIGPTGETIEDTLADFCWKSKRKDWLNK